MDAQDYPRPTNEPVEPPRVPFPADANWALWSGILGLVGLSNHLSHALGHDHVSVGQQFSAAVLVFLSILRLVGTLGIFLSRTWGFVLIFCVSVLYGLNSAFGAFSGAQPVLLINVVANLWFAQYCVSRLRGKRGTRPL